MTGINWTERLKKWMESLVLMLAGILVALLMLELAVRIVKPRRMVITGEALHRSDRLAGWVGRPNVNGRFSLPGGFDVLVAHNSRGLRDTEKSYAKPDGTRRIVVLGDSFMWGFGVENHETFSALLQENLPDTETINFGVSAYSTVQELVRFETEGIKYQPDFTLLAFCWNDLGDNFNDEDIGKCPVVVVEGSDNMWISYPNVEMQNDRRISRWFRQHSHLFGFVEYRVKLIQHKLRQSRGASSTKADPEGQTRIENFSEADIYAPPSPEIDLAWKVIRFLVQRINHLTADSGGQLIVVYVTPKESASADLFDTLIRKAGLDPASDDIDRDRPSNRLRRICEDLNIPYVSLDAAFRRHPEPLSLFWHRDPHWSPQGHRLAADTVAAYIETLAHTTGSEIQSPQTPERQEPDANALQQLQPDQGAGTDRSYK